MSNAPDDEHDPTGRNLLLGVTGSIAAYKAAPLVRLFKKAGAQVQVLMTEDAARFIAPLTLGTLSEREVLTEIFPENGDDGSWTKHVDLGRWSDLFVIAPATAQTIARLAGGFCDSMLTATALSARCPLLVCPAMDRDMYAHPATQRNLRQLAEDGCAVMDAEHGELASGLTGPGRLPEPEAIFERATSMLDESPGGEDVETLRKGESPTRPDAPTPERENAKTRKRRNVLITAGPTREHLDPVRFLSNPSTGTMGFALARAAARRGARVTLVAGPTSLDTPPGVAERIDVETAREMHAAVTESAPDADLVIMAAAVSDYAPAETRAQKLKKGEDTLTLNLERTPEILAELGEKKRDGQTLVGFALETENGAFNAREKLRAKHLDWIALNVLGDDAGFGAGTNRVTLIGKDGAEEELPMQSKRAVAEAILTRVAGAD